MNAVFTLYLNVASGDYRQRLQRMLGEQRAGTFDHFEAVHLLAAVQEVEQFFAAYQPGGRSLVFIFDRIDRFLWTRELQVPLRDMVHLSVRPYLRPLAEAMDAFPHYGVAVVEKNAVRLFTVGLGDIEEYSRPSVGVVDAIRRMVRSQHLAQLILAGQLEITTELRHTVAKRLGPILIGTIELDFNTEPAEIFQRTLPVAEELKRKEESEIVRDLTVQPAEGSWAVTGLGTTLDLLNKGRIWQLVYAEGLHGRALECRQCAAIFSESHEHCVYCGSPLEAVGNLADLIYKHSMARGARVRKISADAAAALSAAGGIGGFVRTADTARSLRPRPRPA
jgi:putative ubiquitin-RnfH superfamily antitoxin RatB of RatAB toxin-antitoxin module